MVPGHAFPPHPSVWGPAVRDMDRDTLTGEIRTQHFSRRSLLTKCFNEEFIAGLLSIFVEQFMTICHELPFNCLCQYSIRKIEIILEFK